MDIDYKRVATAAAWAEEIYWLTGSLRNLTEIVGKAAGTEKQKLSATALQPVSDAISGRLAILLGIEEELIALKEKGVYAS